MELFFPLNKILFITENADFTDAYIGQFDIKNLCKNPTLKVRNDLNYYFIALRIGDRIRELTSWFLPYREKTQQLEPRRESLLTALIKLGRGFNIAAN